MQLAETLSVGGFGFFEVPHWPFAEEEAEHGAHTAGRDRQTCCSGGFFDASHEFLGGGCQLLVAAGLFEQLEGFDPGCHGQGVSTEGAGLVHRSGRRHHLHDVAATAVGADGKSATDHFAHGGEVGRHAEMGLRSAVADAEAGHHFVEHQQGAVFLGEFT